MFSGLDRFDSYAAHHFPRNDLRDFAPPQIAAQAARGLRMVASDPDDPRRGARVWSGSQRGYTRSVIAESLCPNCRLTYVTGSSVDQALRLPRESVRGSRNPDGDSIPPRHLRMSAEAPAV